LVGREVEAHERAKGGAALFMGEFDCSAQIKKGGIDPSLMGATRSQGKREESNDANLREGELAAVARMLSAAGKMSFWDDGGGKRIELSSYVLETYPRKEFRGLMGGKKGLRFCGRRGSYRYIEKSVSESLKGQETIPRLVKRGGCILSGTK